ncbi:FKBP-type peptidyl-prolyl cis-trans isomerase [Actinoplanes sp. NPDC049265]|uniref:FKBP-type peptidyl-prolyl cis-trans isomerase n=1 Tax=Actinoplanes sp. NPDC049265 TaxID=3363902 RepID=UPI003710D802
MSNPVQTTAGRGRAIAGALAGVAVVVLLVVVFFVVQNSDDKAETPAAAPAGAASEPAQPTPADQAPAEQPSEQAAPSAPPADPRLQSEPKITAGKGKLTKLVVNPLVPGRGPRVKAGQQLTVNYVGATYGDGKVFESSFQSGQPATFQVGVGQLIPGWDQGLVGVPVGSRIQLDIPSDLAYGDNPGGGRPAGALRFVIDILQAA